MAKGREGKTGGTTSVEDWQLSEYNTKCLSSIIPCPISLYLPSHQEALLNQAAIVFGLGPNYTSQPISERYKHNLLD